MDRITPLLLFALLAAPTAVPAEPAPAMPHEQPALHALADAPSEAELRATITKLVGFGTRHTLSDTTSATRGIGAARRWVKSRFEAISRDCGGCIEVVTPSQVFSGKRTPQPTEVMDVVAIKRGKRDPDRVIVMTGHLDSRVTDVMNATSDAPGANDDASGVAALIEAARLLSKQDNDATLVFAALSGEEQGLFEEDDTDAVDACAIPIVALSMLAVTADRVVGTVRIHEETDGVWWGSRLAVAADYRKVGALGASLIRLAVSSAHARECPRFLARVQEQNVLFFRRLHWRSIEEIELLGRRHHLMMADLDHYGHFENAEQGFRALARKAA